MSATSTDLRANLAFVADQSTHVEEQVYRHKFPDVRYPGLIPVDMEAEDWASSVTYYSSEETGQAAFVADKAKDIPFVGQSQAQHEVRVHMAAIGYQYGIEEVNRAISMGRDLTADHAMTARRAYERFVDTVAFDGAPDVGFEGFLNYSGVPVAAAAKNQAGTSALWADKTADEMIADCNAALIGVHQATKETEIADTLLLPTERYQALVSTRVPDTNMTGMEYLQKANIFKAETGQDLTVRSLRGLSTAGGGSTARMIAYRNNQEVLKLHIPHPLEFLPVQIEGLAYQVPGIFRLAGLDVRLPLACSYVDGF